MAYILSQIFGFLVFIFVFVSMQTKSMKNTLLCQFACNGLGMISYVLIGGFSGFGIYLVATVQSLVFYFLRKNDRKEPAWLYPVIFGAYLFCAALTFRHVLDIIPTVAALLCALALLQKKPAKYRIVILLNGVVWVVYDLCVGAYTMLASHIFTVVSALLGIIRIDILKK